MPSARAAASTSAATRTVTAGDVFFELLDRKIGELKVTLDGEFERGRPNGHERLIAAAMAHALRKSKQPVDAVFHGPFFDAIHKGGSRMRSEDEIVNFAASLGINGEIFRDAMYSFAAESNMRRAMQLAEAYRLTGVPTLTVSPVSRTIDPTERITQRSP